MSGQVAKVPLRDMEPGTMVKRFCVVCISTWDIMKPLLRTVRRASTHSHHHVLYHPSMDGKEIVIHPGRGC